MRVIPLLLSLIGLSLTATTAQAEWRGFATADVNMRTGPGTGYSVVDVVPEGVRVFVDYCQGSWCAVDYRGEEGFVSRRFLEQARVRDYAPQGEIYVEPDYDDTPYYEERRARPDFRRQLRRENRRLRRERRAQDEVIVRRETRRNRELREQRRQRRDGRRNQRRNRVENNVTPLPSATDRPSRRDRAKRRNRRENADQQRRNRPQQQARGERRRDDTNTRRPTESAVVQGCPNNMVCDGNGKVLGFGGK